MCSILLHYVPKSTVLRSDIDLCVCVYMPAPNQIAQQRAMGCGGGAATATSHLPACGTAERGMTREMSPWYANILIALMRVRMDFPIENREFSCILQVMFLWIQRKSLWNDHWRKSQGNGLYPPLFRGGGVYKYPPCVLGKKGYCNDQLVKLVRKMS